MIKQFDVGRHYGSAPSDAYVKALRAYGDAREQVEGTGYLLTSVEQDAFRAGWHARAALPKETTP